MTQADAWVVPDVASDNEYVIPIRNTIDVSIYLWIRLTLSSCHGSRCTATPTGERVEPDHRSIPANVGSVLKPLAHHVVFFNKMKLKMKFFNMCVNSSFDCDERCA